VNQWKLVPVEPTDEQVNVDVEIYTVSEPFKYSINKRNIYRAMVAAAPTSDARDEAIRRMRKALDAIYNHNEACRAAVLEHYGNVHDYVVMEIDAASADKESGGG